MKQAKNQFWLSDLGNSWSENGCIDKVIHKGKSVSVGNFWAEPPPVPGHEPPLRECELDAALAETRADLAAGRFVEESAAEHLARLDRLP